MCGILAYCAPTSNALPDEDTFQSALSIMQSRGPDADDIQLFRGDGEAAALFGHRRLSIQDLSTAGTQPMASACGRFAITYNGEVYNTPSLREELKAKGIRFRSSSDTEVILESFALWGKAILGRLHGMFAFAVWDKVLQVLTVARDHVGIKPLYYSTDTAGIALASDARALRKLGSGKDIDVEAQALYLMLGYVPAPYSIWKGIKKLEPGRFLMPFQIEYGAGIALASDARALRKLGSGKDIDVEAQALYLMLGYVPAPYSIWKGIKKLEPGRFLEWSPGCAPTIGAFWSAPDALDDEGNSSDLADLIDEVVAEQLLADVPMGVFLSGGIDSSVIASSIAQIEDIKADLLCLSIGFPDNPKADEAPVAKRTAEALGLDLNSLALAHGNRPSYREAVATLDEPLSYSAIVTQVAISRLAANSGLTVVLTGDGGDEVFGGYKWYNADLSKVHKRYVDKVSFTRTLLASGRARRREAVHDYAWAQSHPIIAHLQSVYCGMRSDQVAELVSMPENYVRDLLLATLEPHYVPELPERRWRQRLDLYTFCADVVLPKVDRATMASSIEARPPLLDYRIIDWALSRPVTPQNDGTPKALLRAILKARGLGFLLEEPKRGFSLKSKDKPSRKVMEMEIDNNSDLFQGGSAWRETLPKSAALHGHRQGLLHWYSLWAEENGVSNGVSN
ncbi:MAG: asparagine synthase-related protein [Pseudomonadota bacterium]